MAGDGDDKAASRATARPPDDRDRRAASHPEETEKYEALRKKFIFESMALVRGEGLEGIGGELKQAPAYFNVTEIPHADIADSADGNSASDVKRNHVWLTLRRSGMNTKDVAWRLEKVLGVNRNSVGYAGLKDRNATCTQTFSIDDSPERSLESIRAMLEADKNTPRVQLVGEIQRASRKLRKGHLRGNRFRILITNLAVDADEAFDRAKRIAEDLAAKGVANYFGDQRLGNNASTALAGYRELSVAREYIKSVDNAPTSTSQNETPGASVNVDANSANDVEKNSDACHEDSTTNAPTTKETEVAKGEGSKFTKGIEGESGSSNETASSSQGAEAKKEAKEGESGQTQIAQLGAKGNGTTEDHHGRPGSKKRKASRSGFLRYCRKNKRIRTRGTFQSGFNMNAFQSAVFNSILSERIRSSMFTQEVVGDIVMNQTGGAARLVDSEETLPNAKDRAEGITFALPLVGDRGGTFSKGSAQELESRIIKNVCDLPWDAFWLSHLRSTLRPARLSLEQLDFDVKKVSSVRAYLDEELCRTKSTMREAGPDQGRQDAQEGGVAGPDGSEGKDGENEGQAEHDGEGLLFTFSLPKGAYATSVLREFMTITTSDEKVEK
ncbi:Pseudouridylate synthase 7-like-like protein [Hondaea fermentalgiana]|uniref:Pseudouridylate synthase 7-like-like protein n=1 Tax=Hondaea fermentalgiana TaxID=2315210 RepID=A0A2R5GFW8_9STRA|nr:Pseudouridylate synthase 7-like-like protein [Hondaea fermentalgiana]|eukprot:GBG29780.1 Pseudouridylate synthase 7-like-like protein [Hondaea fermentalgiana]